MMTTIRRAVRDNLKGIFNPSMSVVPFGALLFLALIVSTSASAQSQIIQSLIIQDCQGFTRAAQDSPQGTTNNVEVRVESPGSTQSEVSLENLASGKEFSVMSQNGLASFTGLRNGVYVVSTPNPQDTVGLITIGSAATVSTALATTVGIGTVLTAGGAGVAVGGGIVSVINDNNNDNNDDDNGAPSPGPGGGSTDPDPNPDSGDGVQPSPTNPQNPPGGNSNGGNNNGNNGNDDNETVDPCDDCKPDELPPPLKDPFFDEEPTPSVQGTRRTPASQNNRSQRQPTSADSKDPKDTESPSRPISGKPLSPSN